MYTHLPRIIVLTRHPECAHNVDDQGEIRKGVPNKQSPLTEVGKLQCDITAKYLKEEFGTFDAVYCSEFLRTRAIPEALGVGESLIVRPELNEWDLGVWHTLLKEDVYRLYPDEEAKFDRTDYSYCPPEGESCIDVEKRLIAFLSHKKTHENKELVYISGHGAAGLCLRRLLTISSVDAWVEWRRMGRPANASVTVFERRGACYYVPTLLNHVPWEGKIDPSLRSIEEAQR